MKLLITNNEKVLNNETIAELYAFVICCCFILWVACDAAPENESLQ